MAAKIKMRENVLRHIAGTICVLLFYIPLVKVSFFLNLNFSTVKQSIALDSFPYTQTAAHLGNQYIFHNEYLYFYREINRYFIS